MDIQVASNFERYLFYLFDENPARVNSSLAHILRNRKNAFHRGTNLNVLVRISALPQ